MTRTLIALALCLSACCCIGGGGGSTTPLDQPITSDLAEATVTVVTADGVSLVRGNNDFTVSVTNADQTPGVLTHVTASMSGGHSATPPTVQMVSPGAYRVIGLDLTMSGQWELDLTLSRDGSTDDDQATVVTDVQ